MDGRRCTYSNLTQRISIFILRKFQMLAHCRARRIANATARQVAPASQTNLSSSRTNAKLAQARRFTHFMNLSTARRTVLLPSASRSSNTPALTTPTTPVSQSMPQTPILPNPTALPAPVATPPTEAEEHARDLRTVRNELNRYKEEPLFAESAPLDLVRYWDVWATKCLLEYTLNLLCNRNRKLLIHLAIKWRLTYCRSRPLLFLANVPSRQVKTHAFFYRRTCSKFCNF
jgi:hypothetical protein